MIPRTALNDMRDHLKAQALFLQAPAKISSIILSSVIEISLKERFKSSAVTMIRFPPMTASSNGELPQSCGHRVKARPRCPSAACPRSSHR